MSADPHAEHQALAERYARRAGLEDRYSFLQPDVWQTVQERQRALIHLLRRHARRPLAELRVAEVGCGAGGNLLELIQLGFESAHLQGLELLPERLARARERLPAAVALHGGDATVAPIEAASQDLVLAATVFSSILDDGLQSRLAASMWSWLRPGGAVLWYDFTVNNPRNPDVSGVPLSRVRALFPGATIDARRVTLAPPLARPLCRLHPLLYPVVNAVPLLRTHRLAMLIKDSDRASP
ncbi:MAG: class I SAM-dependent methyltransferase [Inhella sp.]|jgi:SAM-dependent methyltransferase|uniref:class I SAM-dependent methyltransferase n=1 Tax=Inhella sp. TaxID=1921806 RepID=UPI0022C1C2ED|nr:class I SAM-dependent methyltransferase [Inhella sp.]MCZ8234479.1 class I SAM-dependent methyltransferase [Inhella sp.]